MLDRVRGLAAFFLAYLAVLAARTFPSLPAGAGAAARPKNFRGVPPQSCPDARYASHETLTVRCHVYICPALRPRKAYEPPVCLSPSPQARLS